MSYFMPILEEIGMFFTDEWGNIVTDESGFHILLPFDYSLADLFTESDTSTSIL